MKVKDLVTELSKHDLEADVLLYIFEDFNSLGSIVTKEQSLNNPNGLYCKGYSFEELVFEEPNKKYIVLCDE